MKKTGFTKLLLAFFPLMTVFVTSSPDGVMFFDGTAVTYSSWLQPAVQSGMAWCAPVAALLNDLVFGLVVIYLVAKKSWGVNAIFYMALAATCIASLPVVASGDMKIVPNVMGIILLAAECITAALVNKNEQKADPQKPKGKRLERR